MRLTHVGGPTVLVEVAGWRLLTDPTFDPPGRRYSFGWGAHSHKVAGPSVPASEVGRIDAVLLSHDQHGDNLDAAGRALLPAAGTVVTTVPGARRIGGGARGLRPGEETTLTAPGRVPLRITATPARHGPPLSRPIAGAVVGFAVAWDGGSLWISGDTVLSAGVRGAARRLSVDVAVLHLGAVRFPVTGPLRYTMTAGEAADLCAMLRPRVAVPVHYEGWDHFHQGRAAVERAFAAAPPGVRDILRWLQPGAATEV